MLDIFMCYAYGKMIINGRGYSRSQKSEVRSQKSEVKLLRLLSFETFVMS
ncbi:hypothetical protein BJP36_41375 [Moorena producens JHB]|uniref:Uncharacterized protein n=1 Tax=Moorena producens (strain JHB) TaxID=1454205 RepID=A0A9Q9SSH6_MOOP1|nr:hypothetical protein [Moorena producens]WAN68816.1 hypothetical protein BJP36_41375 [Moorena producens JHB]